MRRCSKHFSFLLGLIFWLAAGSIVMASTVSTVRFGAEGERTRIVIDIDALVEVVARTVASPPRLIVDMPAVEWSLQDHPQSRPRGFATGLRFGQINAERSRLVIDMATEVEISAQQMIPAGRNGLDYARIVIDVIPATTPQSAPAPAVSQTTPTIPPATTPPNPRVAAPLPSPPRPTAQAPSRAQAQRASETPPPSSSARRPVIAIDAGHGGIDPGAVASDGTLEKNITLAMSRELAQLLDESGRYEAFLVRDDDVFIKLRNRIAKARTANADVFISVHADSIGDADLRGASVYTLSETASDREAGSLAAKENKADIIGGTDLTRADEVLASILIDLSQRSTNNESIKLADLLVGEIGEVTKLVKNTRRYAGFAVLKAPDMPSVLLELGYLSNRSDAQRLLQSSHRAELGRAIVEALDSYFQTLNGDG